MFSSSSSSSGIMRHAHQSARASTRICENALDRLALKLLDWKFLELVYQRSNGNSNTTSSTTNNASGIGKPPANNPKDHNNTVTNSNDSSGSSIEAPTQLPTTYSTFFQYVHTWEPLLLEEIKEQTYSEFTQNIISNQIYLLGSAHFSIADDSSLFNNITVDMVFRSPSTAPNSNGNRSNDAGMLR